MRSLSVLGLVALLPLGSGCNLAYYAGHNLVNEPVTRADEHKLSGRLRSEARAAWRNVCRQHPRRHFTAEFIDGFTDGYADHLESGGPAVAPAVPPLRYRRADYLTPQGQPLVRDYLVGAQYGAEVASASGRRQSLTVPVLVSTQQPDAPLSVVQFVAPPAGSLDAPGSVPPRPPVPVSSPALPLPAPRPLVPAPDPPRPETPKVEVPAVPDVLPVAAGETVPDALPTLTPNPEVPMPEVVPPEHVPPASLPPTPPPVTDP